MKEYNFSGKMKLPDGSDLLEADKPIFIYELLGNMLMGKTDGIDVFKAIGWTVELTKEAKIISMDDSDKEKLLKFIEASQFGNIVKYNLLNILKSPEQTEL